MRHLLYSPVKDILLLSVWFDAIFNRRVRWRGHSFLVGRMTRLRQARAGRQVRRRVRRVRQFRHQQGTKPVPPTNPSVEPDRSTPNPAIDPTRSAD
jgi:ceramide glucosyltransferase